MRSAWAIKIILLIFYCIPFAFLSANGDAAYGTMAYYAVMLIGFALLCWIALKTNNILILYIGNALSFASSYAAAAVSNLGAMDYYFKPFTSYSLIATISIALIIIQTIVILICKAIKK